ncbi:MAG TPA: anthranilate synthase component I family protein [Bacteroidia bacterium]
METIQLSFENLAEIKKKIYAFVSSRNVFQIFDSNNIDAALDISRYELLAGFSSGSIDFEDVKVYSELQLSGRWTFASINYPQHPGQIQANVIVPEMLFIIRKKSSVLELVANGIEMRRFSELCIAFDSFKSEEPNEPVDNVKFNPCTDKSKYIQTVEKIKQDIKAGSYYEMNYCIEFKAKFQQIANYHLALRLCNRSPSPFSVYMKSGNKTILCSSPERFICKQGDELISQPIKGTNKRLADKANFAQMQALKSDEKERAENVMIVDLVRNDLARICKTGSIKVKELFGTYPFRAVNHLISTISGTLKNDVKVSEIFESAFPMGSMTGAPKIEVMKHILKYEDTPRGLYSGTIGYIEPEGDFDFNVVIRTLVFDETADKISYHVGSAITFDSDAEKEYEECLLKGSKLAQLFNEEIN